MGAYIKKMVLNGDPSPDHGRKKESQNRGLKFCVQVAILQANVIICTHALEYWNKKGIQQQSNDRFSDCFREDQMGTLFMRKQAI